MAEETRPGSASTPVDAGPFLAKVVSHLDPTYMGKLEVQILREVGNDEAKEGQLRTVSYLSPFYGVTNIDYVGEDPDDYNNTQKSYGMWMIPPDVGSIVVVIFIGGDVRKGYWIGCVLEENMNFGLPGYAATKYVVDDTKESGSEYERVPVSEYNKIINPTTEDPTKINKPEHPLAKVLETQGLLLDDVRGISSSSARRETPSMVFGISTPGPIDKTGKAGRVGKSEHKIPNAFVSRLGGSAFVMDDGDDKWLRKQPAGEGPPEYAAVENGETGGNVSIPHNELVRIRTRTGHQILLHNSEDLIYIGNSKGTTWIELTSNGKIDIYAKDSVSVHTENDLNVTADRDINLTAGRNINLNAGTNFNLLAGANYEIKAGADGKLTVGGTSNISAGGNHLETAAAIHMNGPTAAQASNAPKANRIPLVEPWAGHENLDPQSHLPESTEATESPTLSEPANYKKYTTATDTFEKVYAPEEP